MSFSILIDEITKNIQKVLDELNYTKTPYLVEPTKKGFGDATCNVCFLLAKDLRKKPVEIAKSISEKYQKYLGELVDRIEAHPSGYLNFYANMGKLGELILKNSITDDYGFIDIGKQNRIVVEHTSVNPNKAIHIGHVRNIVIGDCLVRILRRANYDVKVLNYIDDSGLQIADIIVGFKHLGFSETPPTGKKFDQYCGDDVYVETTTRYASQPELQETRKQVLQEIEEPSSETSKFSQAITRRVLSSQLETCWNLGATYDCLNFESQIIHSGLWKKIFEKLKELELIEFEKEGANAGCWIILGEQNENDKILLRSDGTATYIAKDVPYAAWKLGVIEDPFFYKKYERQQPDGTTLWETTLEKTLEKKQNFTGKKVITVIDSRQTRLQNIVKNLITKFTSKESYIHLGYEAVTLSAETSKQLGIDTGGKRTQMSGRKGFYVNADSVLELLEKKAAQETKQRNPDFEPDKLSEISHDIAVGTIRYEMIKQDLDKIITFDLAKSLSLEGDTASYIQYTYARAERILEKAGFSPSFDSNFNLLETEYEKNLIKTIGLFPIQVKDAAHNYSPKVSARFCYELAVLFNAFYEHVRVLGLENSALSNVRLCLVFSFKKTIENALGLLGIPHPSHM